MARPASLRRRHLLALAALAGTARAQTAAPAAEPPRMALLIGNREYPNGEDLPPVHKNVRDLKAALEKRGFACTEGLDLDLAAARALMDRFSASVRAAPAESTVFFYFSGHGAQVDAENLLVSAHQNPKAAPASLARGSMKLTGDVIGHLPLRPTGLTIAVLDACRTSLASALQGDGLNQVEAPPGCLIAFATGAGKPAIAPVDETRNTFYTGSLVKLLESASDEVTFSDLFRMVKTDVQNTMLNHPVVLLRKFAQFPFIAENTQVRRRIAPLAATAEAPPRFGNEAEAAAFARLEAALWPHDVARLAAEFLQTWPKSRLAASAQVAQEGAGEAATLLRRADVRLFRSAFDPAGLAPERVADLAKAGRGDKDAAARLGRLYRGQSSGRYEGWLQYAAALGNGIAAYELALAYRRLGQPLLAAQFEGRARDLGYTPPPSLDNTRK